MTTEASAEVLATETGEILVQVSHPEATSDNSKALEMAELHAETAIEIETIHAETERHRIDTKTEGNELWKTEMMDLKEQVQALGEAVSATAAVLESLLPPSTPEASQEVEAVEIVEPLTMMGAEAKQAATELNSTETEALEKSRDESPDPTLAIIAGQRHRVRMI